MKTISYNPDTHRLVPVEPTESMAAAGWDDAVEHEADNVDIYDIAAIYRAMLSAAPVFDTVEDNLQPEKVESEGTELNSVEPVGYVISGGKFNGRLLQPYEYELNVHPELERWKVCCRPLYTAPPDYEAVKKQRDELAKALESIVVAANESDESWYGTLGTRFVRDIAEPALASVKGEEA